VIYLNLFEVGTILVKYASLGNLPTEKDFILLGRGGFSLSMLFTYDSFKIVFQL